VDIDLTLKNYRCFPDTHPVRLTIRPGVTAFIGANNSGKSSMLRFFYEFRQLFQDARNPNALNSAFGGGTVAFTPTVQDAEEVFAEKTDRPLEIAIDLRRNVVATQDDVGVPYVDGIALTLGRGEGGWTGKFFVAGAAAGPEAGGHSIADRHITHADGSPRFNIQYFLEACRVLGSTFYAGAFRNAVNIGSLIPYYDIQVGQAFVTQWRTLQTGTSISSKRMVKRITTDIAEIFGFSDLEIHASEDGTTLQLLIDGNPRLLSTIGSGIAQFILVLTNAAMAERELVLIDEPELNLHPSMQVAFTSALERHGKTGVVFATHSVGLARTTAQSIYSFLRVAEGETEVRLYEDTPRLGELLGEMGFAAYREVGYEKVLLVEGPTEVKAVRGLLRLYGKDHLVVPVPLFGSSTINAQSADQLAELRRLCDDVSAIIDSERGVAGAELEAGRRAFVQNCEALNMPCRALERRAMENYFPERAVREVMGEKYNALGPYQKLSDVQPSWGKADNWKIASEMNREDLDGTDLGDLLERL
jgi:ABC-type Mn2+/Zn2+ transport system ATPase subunit